MELLTPSLGIIVWSIICLLGMVLWIFALVDVIKRDFNKEIDKLVWVLIILFVPIIGSIMYLIWGRRR